MKKFFAVLLKNKQGFSFIEFAVVLSVFAIMSGVILFNFQQYTQKVDHTNAAYLVALELKTAQSLGVGAAGDDSVSSGLQQTASVAFKYDVGASAFSDQFIVFRDNIQPLQGGGTSKRGVYESTDVLPSDRRSQLTTERFGEMYVCTSGSPGSGTCNEITGTIGVSFERPDPEPILTADDTDCTISLPDYAYRQCVGSLYIEILNIRDEAFQTFVVIEPSGLIRIVNS